MTSVESKRVMLRAEHKDQINVESLGECLVVQRTHTYFGPKLRVEPIEPDDPDQYLLHAPGPRSELQLTATDGTPLRTVKAELTSVKQYDMCPYCGEPLSTAEHRRRAFIGACTN